MGLEGGEVEGELLLEGGHDEEVLLGFADVSHVHGEQADLLSLRFLLELLVVLEESLCSLDDFGLVDAPEVLQSVDHRCFFVEGLQNLLVGHVVKTQDTVTDTRALEDLDPADFRSVVAVGSAAGLHINTLDINHADLIARHDTALVEVEAMLGLCLLLAFEVLADGMGFEDDAVGFILDLHFLLLGD